MKDSEPKKEPIPVQIDPDLQAIAPVFLEETREKTALIRAALKNGDRETVQVAGHTLKGEGASYGFDDISRLGRTIELAETETEIHQALDELQDYLDRVVIA